MKRLANPLSRWLTLMIVLLGCFPLVSAQNGSPLQDETPGTNTQPSSVVPQPLGDHSEQKTISPADSSAPKIGPGDELEITIYGVSDLTTHARVSSDGNISMPLIGDVPVAGLTSSEAERSIAAGLRRNNILKDPQV